MYFFVLFKSFSFFCTNERTDILEEHWLTDWFSAFVIKLNQNALIFHVKTVGLEKNMTAAGITLHLYQCCSAGVQDFDSSPDLEETWLDLDSELMT